jgi:hypothetical protein
MSTRLTGEEILVIWKFFLSEDHLHLTLLAGEKGDFGIQFDALQCHLSRYCMQESLGQIIC